MASRKRKAAAASKRGVGNPRTGVGSAQAPYGNTGTVAAPAKGPSSVRKKR